MRVTLLFAATILVICGFNLGLVAGLVLSWFVFRRQPARSEDEIWSDYSGGI